MTQPTQKRFWAKVEKTEYCWKWTASRRDGRYGNFSIGSKKLAAHRVSWLLFTGRMPKKHVLHACDNVVCVRPSHLFLGTQGANIKDCYAKGRRSAVGQNNARAKLTEDNVRFIRKNYRRVGGPHSNGNGKELGKKFGVSTVVINWVVRKKSWKHVK